MNTSIVSKDIKVVCKKSFNQFIQGVIYEGILNKDRTVTLILEPGLNETVEIAEFDQFFMEI